MIFLGTGYHISIIVYHVPVFYAPFLIVGFVKVWHSNGIPNIYILGRRSMSILIYFSWGLAGQAAQPRFCYSLMYFYRFFIVLNVPIFLYSFVCYKFQQKIELMTSYFVKLARQVALPLQIFEFYYQNIIFTIRYVILLHMLHV